ncbi:hypothetical protein NPX13_g10317 [Xylaria arbuscula]|uniref:DNA mismatch repair protein S5 domain-containing protein n=1 Tax=Xylaria arbuscula TaxID=114810 RepID=A0A9W8N4S8_9PEZI|nr:hypothetical protein NPX13_g10317 [Xylaria arbuscula]
MPSSSISRLPASTARHLGADVVIASPTLVVKELLDNAIDAKATWVEILISSDTISKVEVRDNGLGIHPDDFNALGRHGYTSKLRNMEELASIVGNSLGFRGEALASINSMARVTITTKTSTEPVATICQLNPHEGGVLTQKPSPAPVGTTISVCDLFSRRPVRKQVAVKEAKKTLDQIQELIRSYIMARPQLRVSFKILQSPAKAWSYSPSGDATVKEAVLQLFGVEVTSNCILKTFESSHTTTRISSTRETSKPSENNFVLEVYLAAPGADLQKLPKHHYCSIDGRPLNVGRGVARRLLKIYLEHLKRSASLDVINDSFFRLDIRFSSGNYDVNVEPSKDDVLLSDEQAVMNAFRSLCRETYSSTTADRQDMLGEKELQRNDALVINPANLGESQQIQNSRDRASLADHTTHNQRSPPQQPINVPKRGHECSVDQLASTQKFTSSQEPQDTQSSTSISFTPINARDCSKFSQSRVPRNESRNALPAPNQWKVDMSVDLDERLQRTHPQRRHVAQKSPDSQEVLTEPASNRGDSLNPWKIAKQTNPSEVSWDAVSNATRGSALTPEPPILRHVMAPPGDLDVPRIHQDVERNKLHTFHQANVPGGPYRSPIASPLQTKPQGISVVSPNQPRITRRRHERLPWTPPSSLDKHRYIDVSQISSTQPRRVDGFKQTQISFGGGQPNRRSRGAHSGVLQEEAESEGLSSDLEARGNTQTQDLFSMAKKNLCYQLSQFEGGKEEGTQAPHTRKSQSHHPQPARQRQPFAVLQTNKFENNNAQEDRQPIATTLPIGDPRAYLLRRQKSIAAAGDDTKLKKMSRIKSSLMPLQNTPPEYETYALSWTIRVDGSMLHNSVQRFKEYDEYVVCGATSEGLDMSLSETKAVESKLQSLLASQKENIKAPHVDCSNMTIDLQSTSNSSSVTNV